MQSDPAPLVPIAPVPSLAPGAVNAETLIRLALENKADVDTLERLLTIRRELQAETARASYFAALASFQGECPVIVKDKSVLNKDGRSVRYLYAPLESILRQVSGLLLKHGFSYRFETSSTDKAVLVSCVASHRDGHCERTSFESQIDPQAFMNLAQKFGSALTFAKRYALCNAFGIVTGDEDDDAQGTEETGSESGRAKLERLRREKAQHADSAPTETAPETPELGLLTDFIAGLDTCIDDLELNRYATQALTFKDDASRNTAMAAVKKKAAALRCVWNKKTGAFERSVS